MAAFNSSLALPVLATDIQRGGGQSLIYIETESDYSAAKSGATWDMMSLFTKVDFDFGSQGGGDKPLDIELVDGTKYTLDDNSSSTAILTKKLTITTARENMMEFLEAVQGKKYFIVALVSRVGSTKRVFFGFGYFDLTLKRSSQYSQVVTYDISFIVKSHGYSGTPTFPALPADTDAKFTTDAINMQYIGWLLSSTDSTKGGYGTVVSLPTTSELTSSKCGIVKSF